MKTKVECIDEYCRKLYLKGVNTDDIKDIREDLSTEFYVDYLKVSDFDTVLTRLDLAKL